MGEAAPLADRCVRVVGESAEARIDTGGRRECHVDRASATGRRHLPRDADARRLSTKFDAGHS